MNSRSHLVELLDNVIASWPGEQANMVTCSLKVTKELADLLIELDNNEIIDPTYQVNGTAKNIQDVEKDLGSTINFEVTKSESPFKISTDFNDFLSIKKAYYEAPKEYYIINEHLYSERDKEAPKLLAYDNISRLIKLLIDICDHKNESSDDVKSVIFLHKNRLEINTHYNADDISIPLDGLSIIEELFDNSEHLEQKKSIFKETISTFLSPIKNKTQRLKFLLKNFSEFSKEFNENYHLFVSDFSFDKVRCEYEESKRKYFVDLNNILSSVQTKMLGIPIALSVAAFKLNSISSFQSFISSTLILIAVICYWLMMKILIKNQRHSLSSLQEEYQLQMTRFQKQYPSQFKEIGDINASLNQRYKKQLSNLKVFNNINHIMFGIVIVIFLYHFPWTKMLNCFS